MKNSYRIGNWKPYNKSLINRGSITFWFSEEAIKKWKAKRNKKHFGRPFVYSDLAIGTSSMIRFFYFVSSLWIINQFQWIYTSLLL